MNVPLRWLREFVPEAPDAARVGEALTMGGFPVEHLSKSADGDDVLDVEVTSNRSDCLSIVGVAREVAALLNLTFIPSRAAPTSVGRVFEPDGDSPRPTEVGTARVVVTIDASDACPYYSARTLRGVTVGPSPAWLATRLEAVGVRAINNVVDVTNYVLFELGQPLHAFDLATLAGPAIVVRAARPGETLVTLDGIDRKLTPTTLVIADAEKSLALAGVMGGTASGVTLATADVLVEAARFEPLGIRQTSRGFALASDSSYRFERGIDPTLARRASDRAVELILQIAGGRADGPLVEGGDREQEPTMVTLRNGTLRRVLGIDFSPDKVIESLGRLGFAPTRRDDAIEVIVPSHRLDVRIEADLVEEVARVIGYDQIPTRDEISVRLTQREPTRIATDVIRTELHSDGYFEALTFSFVSDALANAFTHDEATTLHRVESATRKADARLRPSVLPNLLESIRHNENVGVETAKLYETASVFWIDARGKSVERRALALVGDDDYRALRGTVDRVLRRLDAERAITVTPTTRAGFGRAACGEVHWGEASVGFIGKTDRAIATQLGLRGLPAIAELWLEPLLAGHRPVPTLLPLPTFPAVRRDLSLLVKDDVRFGAIESVVRELKLDALEAVDFVTTYRGKPLEADTKSVTITLAFRKSDGTLTSAEVDERVGSVIASAREKLGATLRA